MKVAEILELQNSGHLVTYNHYLTENVQKVQAEWLVMNVDKPNAKMPQT